MKKLLYVGHDYHLKTKSVKFLFELLETKYEITSVSFNPYDNKYHGLEEAKKNVYDVLLVFQVMPDMSFLTSNFVFATGVFIPMYDYIVTRNYDPWPDYRRFKIINFCKTTHDELIKRGYNSYYIQYFPKPVEEYELGSEKSVFFWQRMENINVNVVNTLLENTEVEHIHIHKSLDPNQKFIAPDESLEKKITYSEWFETPEDMHRIMEQSSLYIAPRWYEGIGMSFLEAMAKGRCVIAPNNPTMNEYIVHGQTGLLYDLNDVKPLKIENIRNMQENAYRYIQNGYAEWEKNKNNILKWIEEEREEPLVTVVTAVRNAIKGGRTETLAQCIESVHNQYYSNVEHLVLDGASDDGTVGLLNQYKKLGWIDFYSEPDSGMYEAMNKGIRKAKGKYIVFLNTDDYFHSPHAISDSVFALENSGADFSFASNRILQESGVCKTIRKPQIGSFVAQMPFCHQTMFTKKSVLIEAGLFNEEYKSSADYDLVLRLILADYKYVEVETDIVTYRNGGVSESMQARSDQEKYEIFKTQYQPFNNDITDEFLRKLMGRVCPLSFLNNVKNHVSEELAEEVDKAVVHIDTLMQSCSLPEEIFVPMEQAVTDSVSSHANERIEKMLEMVAKKDERINKFMKYFALLDRWLWIKLQDKNIKDYFEDNNYKEIAIYGIGEIGNRLFEELSRTSNINVKYAIDTQKGKTHPTLKVYNLEDELPQVDVIVVSVNNIYSQIEAVLKEKTDCHIISIDDVIFNVN